MKKTIFVALAFILLPIGIINAQMALAVSKNENGSSIKYSLKKGKSTEDARQQAFKELEDLMFTNIFHLKSEENTGHELNKGFYVLIVCSRKDNSGRYFFSYGLGLSQKSKAEALERAMVHLREFDWGYQPRFGYAIEKEGMVESFGLEPKKN
jgi:hypothetical protein